MVSHHPGKFGVYTRHYGCGDIMFSLVEGQDSTCSRLIPPLLFISKVDGVKALGISY